MNMTRADASPWTLKKCTTQNRRMCNELVYESCKEIPIVNTPKRFLLTSRNMHTYLGPRFRKMLIYRDAIAFLKAKLHTEDAKISIQIDQVNQNNENEEPIVVVQSNDNDDFMLKTNHLRVLFKNRDTWPQKVTFWISDCNGQFAANAQLHYLLRLIAPLVQPIHLFYLFYEPIDPFMRFLSAHNDMIDSIGLTTEHFNSAPIDGALAKCNKLEIVYQRSPAVNVPKLVRWLTNGQSEKCLSFWGPRMADVALFLDETKEDFARAKGKHQFVVRLAVCWWIAEFAVCNELTGEKLELRRTGVNNERFFYALCRGPNDGLDNNEKDNCTEFDTSGMTRIYLRN